MKMPTPENASKMQTLLTEEQAAETLHVCTRTMRRLRKRGEIRYVAITSRTILYRPEDIAAFVEQRATIEDTTPSIRSRPNRKRANEPVVLSFTARRAGRRSA